MNIRNLNIKDASSDALQSLYERIGQELQDREVRTMVQPGFTNEQVFEDALTMGLTPDDPDVIAGGYSEEYADYIAQKERKQTMNTTGA